LDPEVDAPEIGSYGAFDDIETDVPVIKPKSKENGKLKDDVDENGEDEEEEEEVNHNERKRTRTMVDEMFDVELSKFDKDDEDDRNFGKSPFDGPDEDDDDEDDEEEEVLPILGNKGSTSKKMVRAIVDELDGADDFDDDVPGPLRGAAGPYDPEAFEGVFDEFLSDSIRVSYQPPTKTEIPSLNQIDGGSDNEEDQIEEIFVKEKKSEWDVESIVSTYSNTDNHPKLITAHIDPHKKIKLKRGIPQIKEETKEEETEDEGINHGQARKGTNQRT